MDKNDFNLANLAINELKLTNSKKKQLSINTRHSNLSEEVPDEEIKSICFPNSTTNKFLSDR